MGWEDIQGSGSEGSKRQFLSFPEGITNIRIIDDAPHSRWAHWMPAARRSVTCTGKGCPICEVIRAAKANKVTPPYNSSKKHSMNVINRTTGAVEIIEQGSDFFQELLDIREEHGDLKAFDIKVKRKGVDQNTSYRLDVLEEKALTDAEKTLIEENRTNLKEFFAAPTNEQIVQLMNGVDAKTVFSTSNEETEEAVVLV